MKIEYYDFDNATIELVDGIEYLKIPRLKTPNGKLNAGSNDFFYHDREYIVNAIATCVSYAQLHASKPNRLALWEKALVTFDSLKSD